LWSNLPDLIACFGILLVFAAGLYLLNRERFKLGRANVASIDRSPAE
jgi:hypothetical protein